MTEIPWGKGSRIYEHARKKGPKEPGSKRTSDRNANSLEVRGKVHKDFKKKEGSQISGKWEGIKGGMRPHKKVSVKRRDTPVPGKALKPSQLNLEKTGEGGTKGMN